MKNTVVALNLALGGSLLALCVSGCERRADRAEAEKEAPVEQEAPPQVVAKISAAVITAAQLRAELEAQPAFARTRYKTPEGKKKLLDTLIRRELLLEEARRRGLDKDPEVKAALEKLLVHKLTRVYAEELDKKQPLSESELQRYYDTHKSEFVQPTRVRVSHLFLAAEAKSPKRTRAQARARRLLRQARANAAKTKQAFQKLAAKHSEDLATKARGGDLGFKTEPELVRLWGPELAAAALALKTAGETAGPIIGPKGVHLIQLLGRQQGYERSFTSARNLIENRLKTQRRSRSLDDMVKELKQQSSIEINDQALSQLELSPPATQADPSRRLL
ncbi:MAG: peptidyl-prolyl cis-trans isomerase [Proteobacteria bacterium]|nr:peptidyl-prolyl cis-trans isomerase [Pseudomonadota bacterium]